MRSSYISERSTQVATPRPFGKRRFSSLTCSLTAAAISSGVWSPTLNTLDHCGRLAVERGLLMVVAEAVFHMSDVPHTHP